MTKHSKTLIVIAGPTASGKTALSLQLAEELNTSIISADSRQCYREMNIGTAKPEQKFLQLVPHYFINSHSITEHITAADYEQLSLNYCHQIFQTRDTAIVCGGTGLYINVLCEGLDDMPSTPLTVIQDTQKNYEMKGIEWLQKELQTLDPTFFEQSTEKKNPARLIRALAFNIATGTQISQYRKGKKKQRPFNIIKIALEIDRSQLYQRIDKRVDVMMKQGLLEEAIQLYPYRNLKNLQTVGYQEFFACTPFPPQGNNIEEAITKIKQHTRNYAKRQLTWFKKDNQYNWVSPFDEQKTIDFVKNKLNNL